MPARNKRQGQMLKVMSTGGLLVWLLATASAIAQPTPPQPEKGEPEKGQPAKGQPEKGEPEKGQPEKAEQIIVTGVRGEPRSLSDTPTPVDVIGGKALEDGGHANLYQDMQMLVPSFNYVTKAGSGTSSAIFAGGLRELNPDHTLVLINGLRRHSTALLNVGQGLYNGSAPVDLGMIPTSAISRIEVLREGAAAQYGSDAIAGVINVILKDTPGGGVSVQYGQNFDRGDGEQLLVRADYGFQFSNTGLLNLFFSATEQKASDRSYPIDSAIQLYPKLPSGQLDPRETTVNRQISRGFGIFPASTAQVGFNSHEQVGGGVELYAFGTFSQRIQDIIFPPIIPNQREALPEVCPNFCYPIQHINERDGQLAIGVRGVQSGWGWDLSTTAGRDHAPQSADGTLNASLGPTTPTVFYMGALTTGLWVTSLDLTRKFAMADGGSLQVSAGAQVRQERFELSAGDAASYTAGSYVQPPGQPFAGQAETGGAFFVPGFRPADAGSWSRNVIAAYGELGYEPTKRLLIDVATRVEKYSDSAGTSVVGKLDGRYKLNDWVNVRGSFGNGFHAPTLLQQHYSKASVNLSQAAATFGQLLTNQLLPVDNPAAIALGAKPLTPEKSVDGSVGLTMNPAQNFNVTVDGYVVTLKDRIVLSSLLQGTGVSNILAAAGLDRNLSGQYFTNAVDTKTSGVDVVATYRSNLGEMGNLLLTAALNRNKTKITHIDPNPAALNALGSNFILVNRVTQGYLTRAIPETKLALGANWSSGPFDFNLQGIRYDEFTVPGGVEAQDRVFPAKWIANIMGRYRINKQVAIAVGADNAFNTYPPATNIPLAQYGYNQLPRISPYGFVGGFYYGRLEVTF